MPAQPVLSSSRARKPGRARVAAALVAAATTGAGLVALAGPASATVPTTLRPMAPRTVYPGTLLAVQARLTSGRTPLAHKRVTFSWRASDTDAWHPAGTLTTNAQGLASLVQRPTATRQYRMRFFGDTADAYTPWVGTKITVAPFGQQVVREASRFAGAPYQYGAAGPYRFDCSGYTQYVFGRLGRALPRTAAEQYARTRHLTHAQMRPGDLVFFGSGGNIYHVGIYAGGGRMWDSPHTGDHVRLQAIWTSAYSVGRV